MTKRDETAGYDDCQITREGVAREGVAREGVAREGVTREGVTREGVAREGVGGGVGHVHDQGHADHADHADHAPHAHAAAAGTARLAIALTITAVFFVVEVIGGVLSNSLALLADAGHMLTDVGALALSLFVAWFSRQPATPRKSFGYLRWEILAALINGAVLLVVSGWILWESVQRIRAPEPIVGGLMLVVATGGLLVNGLSAWLLHRSAAESLNLRGAYLHVLSDLLGSVAAIVAALAVRQFGWLLADPLASILMTGLIIRGAWRLVREAVDVLLEATPAHIDLAALRTAMQEVRGVGEVHDLHVWTLTSGVVAMSAHAVVPVERDHQAVLEGLHRAVGGFGIRHATIQLEGEPLTACGRGIADHTLTPATS
ncbi:MAG: cation diffusion facilitator family transporter [Gemmatimonadaceae bacterium]